MNWMIVVLLIVIGVGLIAVDFYLPGFVLGSVGVVLMLLALLVCKAAYGLTAALVLLPVELVVGVGMAYVAIKYVPQTRAGKKLILGHTQEGMRAQTQRGAELVGREGVAQTVLRPAGMAVVDGKRLDVKAESGMIAAGSAVRVVAVQDNNVIVRKI